jgi:hypothetical protein
MKLPAHLKEEWKRHLGVINETSWAEKDKAEIRSAVKFLLSRDGELSKHSLPAEYRWNWCAARLRDGIFTDWDGFQFRSDWAVTFMGLNGFHTRIPKWNGHPVKHLVVLGEQGLGDEILFMSALPELIVRLGHDAIEVQCYPQLKEVVERSFKVKVTERKKLGGVTEGDALVALGDLFPFYRRDVSHFPRKPYLKADPEKVEHWKGWLKQFGDSPKMGLSWYSRHGYVNPNDLIRKGYVYFDLQYVPEGVSVPERPSDVIEVPFDTKNDFDNLFAFVKALDGVHSVTQTLVHVAGSQGVECHAVIPPRNGEAKWFLWYHSCKSLKEGKKKHWPHLIYPSVKVYEDINEFRNHFSPG